MNLVIFNIYNDYNFRDIDLSKSYYVQSLYYYNKDLVDDTFISELEGAIIRSNGDSINTSIQLIGNTYYVEISLLNRFADDFNEDTNDYAKPSPIYMEKLEKWLDVNMVKASQNEVKELFYVLSSNDDGYYIKMQKAESSGFTEPIINDFLENDIDFKIVKTMRFTHNAGASSIGEGILIWISKKFGDLAFDMLKKHIRGGRIEVVETEVVEKIKDYLESNYHVSRVHLSMKDTNTLDNGDKEVSFSTFYQDFTATYDEKNKVKNVKRVDRSQTRI